MGYYALLKMKRRKLHMKFVLDLVRGGVIGLANIIPGVSGGTMMVSMGIYDTLIYCINHLFSDFKKSIKTLLPYLIGMIVFIALGAIGLKAAFAKYPLPTNALFIGLIIGSVPLILKLMGKEKTGVRGILAFAVMFAVVIVLKAIEANNTAQIETLDLWMIVKLFLMGSMCSAAMVVPGVSGSMLLKTLGYYDTVVTKGIPDLLHALTAGDWSAVGHNVGILLPFGIGIIVGILAIAKLISFLLKKWKGITYCAILGMVAASPAAIMMDPGVYVTQKTVEGVTETVSAVTPVTIAVSVVCLALGIFIAMKLGGEPENPEQAA